MKQIILLFATLFSMCNCQSNAAVKDERPDGAFIQWDKSTMQKVADGGYCRLVRLNKNSVIVTFNGSFTRSDDNGKSWQTPKVVFQPWVASKDGKTTTVNIANLEIIKLKDGSLVAGCNYRPQEPEITPFAIAIKRSLDDGKTWTEANVIYNAQPRFIDGCWEPAFLQLPNGDLQCYFANEGPYTNSDEQEIGMLTSKDNGKSWDNYKKVSFRENRRDGMPVPIILEDEILVAIEDNKIDQFKPYIVKSKISDAFSKCVDKNSQDRYYALQEELPDSVYAGAPYIVAMPNGVVVMSYQTTEGRNKNWELSTMEVAISDKDGRNFKNRTRPFDIPLQYEGKWNSVAKWDDNTVAALTSTNFAGGAIETWIILGRIVK